MTPVNGVEFLSFVNKTSSLSSSASVTVPVAASVEAALFLLPESAPLIVVVYPSVPALVYLKEYVVPTGNVPKLNVSPDFR